MNKLIRVLTIEDLPALEAMETGIDDDYIIRVFDRICSGNNKLFGLFTDGQLVSIGGLTVFAGQYAILGRMRSDLRFRGNNLSTTLMAKVLEEAFDIPDIKWVGANTQEENLPAQRVLKKIGLSERHTSYSATAEENTGMVDGGAVWQRQDNIDRKKHWLKKLFTESAAIFPFECYYPIPASESLFEDSRIAQWNFFENKTGDRVLITKRDFKKYQYLHAVYPFEDLTEQPGLWETISFARQKMADDTNEETHIWMDLTVQQTASLPDNHAFVLPSPWILYGTSR
ncbi:GNAT family N-acetyltransferase; N-acetyltransferase [Planococcus sp. X10-3]|uniref:GNAT family N-acetyltransferase n=1 Tax=Planococcus sp. X10-3 TaxID=3061240 RepID=UPI003BAF4695